MSGLSHHLSFVAPLYLLALLAVPLLLAFAVIVRRRRSRYTLAYTNLGTLSGVTAIRRGRGRRWLPVILLALALAAVAAALAKPQIEVVSSDPGATIILLADVSGSMQATDIRPSRLDAAINGMRDFLAVLPKSDKVGLVTFSDNVQVIAAPTTDRAGVESGLGVLAPEGGTALGSAIEAAVRMIVSTLAASGVHHPAGAYLPAAIVLESDGRQDRGTVSPSAAAAAAKAAGVRIYGVALGTRHGYITQGSGLLTHSIRALPDPGTIALLARETGGEAFSARSSGALDAIYRHLGSSVVRRRRSIEITSWLELAAAVLLVAGVAAARWRGGALP